MALPQRIVRFATFGTIFVAALFAVLSTAGNHWISYKSNDAFHSGLWKKCDPITNKCNNLDGGDSLKATKALMVLTCLCYAFAFAYCGLLHFMKDLHIKFLGVILFVTCLLNITAMSVYTDKIGSNSYVQYEWSYVLGWCSAILTLIASVMTFFDNGYTELE